MKKTKRKKKKKEKTNQPKKYRKTPEDILFGFLMIFSVAFIIFCSSGIDASREGAVVLSFEKNVSPLEKNISRMVSDYPIEEMTPFIAKQEPEVAAFLIAIAKKESNWGKYSPKKNGKECYNYWGYRGKENATVSGYSCFSSPEQAVDVVGGRIGNLVAMNIDTPKEMVLWKCGPGCSGPSSSGAAKWIRDVDLYFKKIVN